MKIYPNPADDEIVLIFEGESQYQLQLFDIKGSLIKSLTLNQQQARHRLSISELENGIYILKVMEEGIQIATEKISIQH